MKRKDRSSSSTTDERKTKKTKKISDLEEVQERSKLDFSSADKFFSSLIAPTSQETFFSEYWEKKPLLIKRKDVDFYGPLFSKSDLEAILKKEEIEFVNDVNVCRYEEGDKLYMNGEVGTRATWSRVSKDVKEHNATVQFHQPQRFKDVLWKLNGHLESIFGCLVGANIYVTPSNSQGLAPHYDDVEVFILQLEGKKQWKLHSCPTELPQDYSPDLEQESIGVPTHEFELQPGDLIYFPRGTVHQAMTPKGDSHSTHITLSTYQQHAWGNLLSTVMSDAIDKAMEVDVKFRQGLPVNCFSYMGLGMKNDGKAKVKQDDFNNQLKQLFECLINHIDAHSSVDKVAADFMANRLPPIEQKEEAMKDDKGEGGKAPTESCEVKFCYPEHIRISIGNRSDIPVGLSVDGSDSEDDYDMSDEEDTSSENEPMDEIEEDALARSSKSKTRSGKKTKEQKSKNAKLTKVDNDEDVENKDAFSKKKKINTEKDKTNASNKKKPKTRKTSGDNEESSNEKKPNSKKESKNGEKVKKSESEEDDDEDDESFELGDEDTEESDDEEESDGEYDGPWVFVNHSLNNNPAAHMIGPQQPSIIKFSLAYKDALLHLYRERQDYVPVKNLPSEGIDITHLLTSLWSEGLITIKE